MVRGMVLIVGVTACGGQAKPAAAPAVAPEAKVAEEIPMGPPLWEVRRGEAVSWLFAVADSNEVPEAVFERVDAADELVVEFDVRSLTDEMRTFITTRTDQSLQEELGPELWERM